MASFYSKCLDPQARENQEFFYDNYSEEGRPSIGDSVSCESWKTMSPSDITRMGELNARNNKTLDSVNTAIENRDRKELMDWYDKLPEDKKMNFEPWGITPQEYRQKWFDWADAVDSYESAPVLEKYDESKSRPYHPALETLDENLGKAILGHATDEYEKNFAEEYPDGMGAGDIVTDLLQYSNPVTAIRKDISEYNKGYVPGILDVFDFVPGAAGVVALAKGAKEFNRARKAGRSLKSYNKARKAAKKWNVADELYNAKKGPAQSMEFGGVNPTGYNIDFDLLNRP